MSSSQLTGSFKLMKSMNRSVILHLIRKHKQISRAEIAKKAHLTPPTVTNIVNELLEVGLVKESKVGESKGGRKPILLSMNSKSFYVVGLDIGGQKIRGVLTDLNAEVEESVSINFQKGLSKEDLLSNIKNVITSLIANSKVEKTKLLGIGIGMHGMVDHHQGVALFAPNLQLTNIPLKKELEEEFDLPVYVENDARAFALGEAWFGNGYGFENLVCINVGIGIGAGIVMNGQLYHGKNNIAGEIGHTIVDINGTKCTCGNYGCLETVASGRALVEKAKEELSNGKSSLLQDVVNKDEITGELIFQYAQKGDIVAKDILVQTGKSLGVGILNLVNFINPERVIIGGGVSKAGSYILDPIQSLIASRALTEDARKTEIVPSKLGNYATSIGAVTLVLFDLFSADPVGKGQLTIEF
ncbi:ROK family transcriptional regulator [Anaerobacillus alkalilacustris]|nr:ROK family transcriptional regulator [Anaerobacillus alkalilacustris]